MNSPLSCFFPSISCPKRPHQTDLRAHDTLLFVSQKQAVTRSTSGCCFAGRQENRVGGFFLQGTRIQRQVDLILCSPNRMWPFQPQLLVGWCCNKKINSSLHHSTPSIFLPFSPPIFRLHEPIFPLAHSHAGHFTCKSQNPVRVHLARGTGGGAHGP